MAGMESASTLRTGAIVRYTDPDDGTFDAIVVNVLTDGSIQIRYQAHALRQSFATVAPETLSVPE